MLIAIIIALAALPASVAAGDVTDNTQSSVGDVITSLLLWRHVAAHTQAEWQNDWQNRVNA